MTPPLVNCGYVYAWGTGLMAQVGKEIENRDFTIQYNPLSKTDVFFVEMIMTI